MRKVLTAPAVSPGSHPNNVALLNRDFPSLAIDTLSAHGSKGLEADHVIVVGMNSGRMGFPSEIVDDSPSC